MDASVLEQSFGTSLFEEAFKAQLPRLRALRPVDIVAVNLSIPTVVTKAFGAEPMVLALKSGMAGALPEADRDLPEKLSGYALALSHAHTLYLTATRAGDLVPGLSEEGMKLRSLLLSDAQGLIRRGFVDGQALKGYKGSVGYRNLAFDLQMLAQVFRSCPESGRDRCAVRGGELQRAEEIAALILESLRKRRAPDPKVENAADMRNRAFTLFTRGYDQLRRAVVFVRWNEGDADRLIPSLYAKRKRVKKKADAAGT